MSFERLTASLSKLSNCTRCAVNKVEIIYFKPQMIEHFISRTYHELYLEAKIIEHYDRRQGNYFLTFPALLLMGLSAGFLLGLAAFFLPASAPFTFLPELFLAAFFGVLTCLYNNYVLHSAQHTNVHRLRELITLPCPNRA